MRTIPAAKFKQSCLSWLDKVGPEGLVITKHGRPVAKLIPFEQGNAELIGCMKGKIRIKKDILTTGEVQDAES
jgi:prevent-host-death family protein